MVSFDVCHVADGSAGPMAFVLLLIRGERNSLHTTEDMNYFVVFPMFLNFDITIVHTTAIDLL